MKEFLTFLIESISSLEDAKHFFGVNDIPKNKEELNKIYKKLSMKYHPDLGGSEEQMKDLNQANDILKKYIDSSGNKKTTTYEYNSDFWKTKVEKAKKENQFLYNYVVKYLDANIKPEIFAKHFQKVFDDEFYAEYIHKGYTGYYSETYVGKLEIKNRNKSIVGMVDITISLDKVKDDLKNNSGIGANPFQNIFQNNCTVNFIIDNKKYKLSKKNWIIKNDFDFFTNPDVLFPTKRMLEIKKKSSVSENMGSSPLKPASLKSVMKTKYDADITTQANFTYFDIPLFVINNEDGNILVRFVFYRNVILRRGNYSLYRIYGVNLDSPYKSEVKEKYKGNIAHSIPNDTYSVLEFLEETIKKAKTKKSMKEVADFLKDAFEKEYNKNMR